MSLLCPLCDLSKISCDVNDITLEKLPLYVVYNSPYLIHGNPFSTTSALFIPLPRSK